jgi:transcriptional regulator with XRE-family HTH domain
VANEDPLRKEIANRLRDAIQDRGLKVAKLERLMKRGRGYVNDALNGSKRLSVELILEVTTWLKVDPREVLMPRHRGDRWQSEIAEPGADDVVAGATALPASLREESLLFQALMLTLDEKRVVSVGEVAARLRRMRGSAT